MLTNLQISPELRKTIDRELQPGEYIRWVEQPIMQFVAASSIITMLFAIPWTGFAIFWMWGALGFRVPDLREGIQPQHLFALFGVPFVLIGLGMLSTPYWIWKATRQTVYLITDQRAILIQGGWQSTIKSFVPDQLQEVYRKEKPDGSGDVIISIRRWKDSEGDQRTEEIGFLGVRNAKDVEMRLKQLAQTGL